MASAETKSNNNRLWQVEWSVAVTRAYTLWGGGPASHQEVLVNRQFFATPEAADQFKKKLVAAAALLGTGVTPVLSEVEVK